MALILEGVFRDQFGVSGQPYPVPDELRGATDLGFMMLPNYRAWVVVASLAVCLRPGTSSSAPSSARICVRAPRTRSWCRRSASTCRS